MRVERTPKVYKAMQLAGVLLLLVGVIVRVGGEFYGLHAALAGVLLFVAGRIGAWWNNG
jgi:hypothetical protein